MHLLTQRVLKRQKCASKDQNCRAVQRVSTQDSTALREASGDIRVSELNTLTTIKPHPRPAKHHESATYLNLLKDRFLGAYLRTLGAARDARRMVRRGHVHMPGLIHAALQVRHSA